MFHSKGFKGLKDWGCDKLYQHRCEKTLYQQQTVYKVALVLGSRLDAGSLSSLLHNHLLSDERGKTTNITQQTF